MENEQEAKKDLIAAAKQLPPMEGGFSLRPRNFDEAFRFANLMAESDLVPKDFKGKPANVLVAVQLGMELGVPPMQAMQNIAVINGRPTIWGDLIPALLYQSGLLEEFDEEGDEKEAHCTMKRKGFKPITRSFSMEEAKKIQYVEWDNGQRKVMTLGDKQTYKSYPKRMLQMRARAYCARDRFPDVLKGLAIREDVEDIEVETTEVKPLMIPRAVGEEATNERKLQAGGETANQVVPEENQRAQGNGEIQPKQNHVSTAPAQDLDPKIKALAFIKESTSVEFLEAGKKWLGDMMKQKGLTDKDKLELCREWDARNHQIDLGSH